MIRDLRFVSRQEFDGIIRKSLESHEAFWPGFAMFLSGLVIASVCLTVLELSEGLSRYPVAVASLLIAVGLGMGMATFSVTEKVRLLGKKRVDRLLEDFSNRPTEDEVAREELWRKFQKEVLDVSPEKLLPFHRSSKSDQVLSLDRLQSIAEPIKDAGKLRRFLEFLKYCRDDERKLQAIVPFFNKLDDDSVDIEDLYFILNKITASEDIDALKFAAESLTAAQLWRTLAYFSGEKKSFKVVAYEEIEHFGSPASKFIVMSRAAFWDYLINSPSDKVIGHIPFYTEGQLKVIRDESFSELTPMNGWDESRRLSFKAAVESQILDIEKESSKGRSEMRNFENRGQNGFSSKGWIVVAVLSMPWVATIAWGLWERFSGRSPTRNRLLGIISLHIPSDMEKLNRILSNANYIESRYFLDRFIQKLSFRKAILEALMDGRLLLASVSKALALEIQRTLLAMERAALSVNGEHFLHEVPGVEALRRRGYVTGSLMNYLRQDIFPDTILLALLGRIEGNGIQWKRTEQPFTTILTLNGRKKGYTRSFTGELSLEEQSQRIIEKYAGKTWLGDVSAEAMTSSAAGSSIRQPRGGSSTKASLGWRPSDEDETPRSDTIGRSEARGTGAEDRLEMRHGKKMILRIFSFVALLTGTFFLGEGFILSRFAMFPKVHGWGAALLHTGLLSSISLLLIYFFVARPLIKHIAELQNYKDLSGQIAEQTPAALFQIWMSPTGEFRIPFANQRFLRSFGVTME